VNSKFFSTDHTGTNQSVEKYTAFLNLHRNLFMAGSQAHQMYYSNNKHFENMFVSFNITMKPLRSV